MNFIQSILVQEDAKPSHGSTLDVKGISGRVEKQIGERGKEYRSRELKTNVEATGRIHRE